jgi:hypothetical protein
LNRHSFTEFSIADSLWWIGQARKLKLPQSMTPEVEANQARRHVQLVLGFRPVDDPITERTSLSAALPCPDRFGDLRGQQALRDALGSFPFQFQLVLREWHKTSIRAYGRQKFNVAH